MRNDPLPALERALGDALAMVRELHAQGALPPVLEALTLIAPPRGFAAQVELRPYTDHARPDEWSRDPAWDPRNGEVHLAFEPARDERGPRVEFERPPRHESRGESRSWSREAPAPVAPPDQDAALRDVVGVVARAEADPAFKFLALKFLRDQLLPRQVAWGQMQSEGQIQINRAIDAGLLVTGKVENPRMPQYPVTTVSLNREHPQVQEQLAAMARAQGAAGSEAGGDSSNGADSVTPPAEPASSGEVDAAIEDDEPS